MRFSLPILAILCILFAASLTAQDFYRGSEVAERTVLVKFRAGAEMQAANIAVAQDAEVIREVGGTGVTLLRSRTRQTAQMLQELRQNPSVEYVEPDYILKAIGVPNDTLFPSLWGMRNTGQAIMGVIGKPGADIGAVPAWDITTGSASIVVGVVDTGVDYTHPDLAANIWSAPAAFTVTIGGNPINCPAGSHGYNAITRTCNPMDDNAHGTHCSGTIGATGNNNLGVAGVNWTTSIMGLKFLSSGGSGYTSDAIDAIEFAIQAKAKAGANVRVLSNSWGGGAFSQALLDEINKAAQSDMLFVAAAGNNGTNNDAMPFYPANYGTTNEIAVAAVDNTDALAGFSNYGASSVNLGAPGVNILSTYPGNQYAWFNGTSMATPHVSGAAALVLSVCNLNTAALKANLLANVVAIPSLNGKTNTGGRLNVNNSIRACAVLTNDFSLSLAPPSRSIAPGDTTTYLINIVRAPAFTDPITFSFAGLPNGVLGLLNPVTANGNSSTLTVYTNAVTSPGTYPFTITGTSGTITHTVNGTLVLTGGDFSISPSPDTKAIRAGTSDFININISRMSGFNGAIGFTVAGLPPGAQGVFDPNPSLGSSSTLAISIAPGSPGGSYPLTITGTSGGLTRTTSATLLVPDFSLVSPPPITVSPGTLAAFSIGINRMGGFSDAVSFSVSSVPGCAYAWFTPPSTTGNSTILNVTTDPACPQSSYLLLVIGTAGPIVHSTVVTLNLFNSPDFSLSVQPPSRAIAPGSMTTYAITVNPVNGFNGSVALSVSGLPNGVLGILSPAVTTSGSTLTVYTNALAPTGTINFTITGTSGGLTHTAPATLILKL